MTVENPKEAMGRAKTPLHLIPPAAAAAMANALWHGAHRGGKDRTGYGEWNWRRSGVNLMTYVGALKRHIDALVDGEWLDPESRVPHLGHVMAGSAVALDAWHGGMLNDDTPGRCLDAVKAGDRWEVKCGQDS